MTTRSSSEASPARRVPLDFLEAARMAACIYVAVRLEIPDRLADGPQSAAALAQASGADASALARVLRALAAGGVLSEEGDGAFALAPVGEQLRRDAPDPLRDWLLMYHDVILRAHMDLLHTVKTGGSGFNFVHGAELFPYLTAHPDLGTTFDRAMTVESAHIAPALLAAYDFSRFERIVDVGGSHGTLLAAILKAHPAMHGVLFDRSRMVEPASEALAAAGLSGRSECVGGSFFRSVPAGCDAYILKNIIHDWNDAHAAAILENCRAAMRAGGRILIVERPLGAAEPGALEAVCADLDMLVLGGADNARERSIGEYEALCGSAGCRLAHVIPLASDHDYFLLEVVAD
jgi:hypothetical protein